MKLLAKIRKINSMLQASAGKAVNFKEMATTLGTVIESNVFIVSRKGKLLGIELNQQIENERTAKMFEERQFPEEYTKNLYDFTETVSNIGVDDEHTAFPVENSDLYKNGLTTIVPINGGGERL